MVADDPESFADLDGHMPNTGVAGVGFWGSGGEPEVSWNADLGMGLDDANPPIPQDGPQTTVAQGPQLLRDTTVAKERFRTRDEAAMAAEQAGLKMTKEKNQGKADWEYAGWIVKDNNAKGKKYTYTVPMVGSERGKVDTQNMLVPEGFTKKAAYHTHPDEVGRQGEGFSTGPLADTGWANSQKIRFYVADVSTRNLYRYDPGVTKIRGSDAVTGDLVGRVP
jgi:hypothetical protein